MSVLRWVRNRENHRQGEPATGFFAPGALPSPPALPTRTFCTLAGWLNDTFRLGWGAFYWNMRKTWFAARGRRGRCPCQVGSDSGRGGDTGCDAVLGYRSPGRFQTLCPLLAQRANGDWVCSVDKAAVRPFWGRVFAGVGLATLALMLAAILGAYALLRGIGYEVSFQQVAWPPAWRQFRQVQSAFYLNRARTARAAGHMDETLLFLASAYELNPADHRTGLLLAQLWQAGQPLLSDQLYARLFREHPAHQDEIAPAWYRALLARGDFTAIQRLARERLLAGGPAPAAWLQALIFACQQTGEPAPLEQLLHEPALPPAFAPLLRLEYTLYSAPPETRSRLLARAAAGETNPFASYHLLSRLLAEGRPDLVLARLAAPTCPLSNRENIRLRLDALVVLGRAAERAGLVRQLLAQPTQAAVCELLSGHLAAHPDRDLLHAYAAKLEASPLPPGEAVHPQLLAFFGACAALGDADLLDTAVHLVNTSAGRNYRTLTAVQTLFTSGAPLRPEVFLPVLQPLPLDTVYALYGHFAPPPPFPP